MACEHAHPADHGVEIDDLRHLWFTVDQGVAIHFGRRNAGEFDAIRVVHEAVQNGVDAPVDAPMTSYQADGRNWRVTIIDRRPWI